MTTAFRSIAIRKTGIPQIPIVIPFGGSLLMINAVATSASIATSADAIRRRLFIIGRAADQRRGAAVEIPR